MTWKELAKGVRQVSTLYVEVTGADDVFEVKAGKGDFLALCGEHEAQEESGLSITVDGKVGYVHRQY